MVPALVFHDNEEFREVFNSFSLFLKHAQFMEIDCVIRGFSVVRFHRIPTYSGQGYDTEARQHGIIKIWIMNAIYLPGTLLTFNFNLPISSIESK